MKKLKNSKFFWLQNTDVNVDVMTLMRPKMNYSKKQTQVGAKEAEPIPPSSFKFH